MGLASLLLLASTPLLAWQWSAQILDEKGLPLPGAKIHVENSEKAVKTDTEGRFRIELQEGEKVYVSFASYQDKSLIAKQNNMPQTIKLLPIDRLGEVHVQADKKSSKVDKIAAGQLLLIDKNEFRKAACCNLSESFETTPSIDVSYSDGFTGMKEIKLLGLDMSNILITLENIPFSERIDLGQGLQQIPATWVESIQLSKGASSVVNSYEGAAGQINIELKKPRENTGGSLNLYQNAMGRSEINADYFIPISRKLQTGILTHYSNRWMQRDQNKDHFMDMPQMNTISLVNNWNFFDPKLGLESQLNLFYTQNEGKYGAMDESSIWRGGMDYSKTAVQWKIGKLFDQEWKSVGLQMEVVDLDKNNYFAKRLYQGTQFVVHLNGMYHSIIANDKNKVKFGVNYFSKQVSEDIIDNAFPGEVKHFGIQDDNIGAYLEYDYLPSTDFVLQLEARYDYNTSLGTIFTPRMHLRKTWKDKHTAKLQVGKASMINAVLADNLRFLNSTRNIRFDIDSAADFPYFGLPLQVTWNFGGQYILSTTVGKSVLNANLDYNYTLFEQGYLPDFETADLVTFAAIEGAYYSHVFQFGLDLATAKNIQIKTGYKYNIVRAEYQNRGLQDLPMIPKSTLFFNVEWKYRKWLWNHTVTRTGSKRVTELYSPDPQVHDGRSPAFWVYSTQLNRRVGKHLEFYAGVENLSGFRQQRPVVNLPVQGVDKLDASQIWGPINTNVFYLGVNITDIAKPKKPSWLSL